ncbi:unnamed protein product [Rotaria sp. Silwood1]|nr:unnamed protein product [Rotaria sp. Silwood1]
MMDLAEKHGYIYLLGLGPLTVLFVHEPDLIADILGRSHAQHYIKPAIFGASLKPLIGAHNILVSEGLEHERARKMLNPAFHFTNLRSMVSIMADQTSKAIDEHFISSTRKPVVDLHAELNTLTLVIIASSAFDRGFETMTDAKKIVCQAFTTVLEAIQYRTMHMINQVPILIRLPFWKKNIIDRGCRDVSEFVDQIIADRRCGRSDSLSTNNDILDLLLSAIDAQGEPFTDQEIEEQALTFVFAGHETAGNLMA